ncbi:MAG: hypothetical protein IJ660_08140, partial [Alphaproteobacteria bacterium]|nr:hypothetical protein [Alphaproteobacteria bacterium]
NFVFTRRFAARSMLRLPISLRSDSKTAALNHSATLPYSLHFLTSQENRLKNFVFTRRFAARSMLRLPISLRSDSKTAALNHSATLPYSLYFLTSQENYFMIQFPFMCCLYSNIS